MNKCFPCFLLTIIVLLAAFSIAPWDATLCHSDFIEDVLKLKNKDGALNCLDFWFNRYQTFVGAVVAIAAAGLAWKGVMKQVEVARHQADIARRQYAASALDPLHKRFDAINKLSAALSSIVGNIGRIKIDLNDFIEAIDSRHRRFGVKAPMEFGFKIKDYNVNMDEIINKCDEARLQINVCREIMRSHAFESSIVDEANGNLVRMAKIIDWHRDKCVEIRSHVDEYQQITGKKWKYEWDDKFNQQIRSKIKSGYAYYPSQIIRAQKALSNTIDATIQIIEAAERR